MAKVYMYLGAGMGAVVFVVALYLYGVKIGEQKGEVKVQELKLKYQAASIAASREADMLRKALAEETGVLQARVLELEADLLTLPKIRVSEVIKYVKVPTDSRCRLDDAGVLRVNDALRSATAPTGENRASKSGSSGEPSYKVRAIKAVDNR